MERYAFDREYLVRLTRGDSETERHFAGYFGDLLLIKLRGRLRSPQLVEDARQEVFLRVINILRNKGGIEHPERFGAFVNSVCENVLLESYRSGSRLQQMPENAAEPVDHGASAESEFISGERKTLIKKVLETLSESDYRILKSVFLEERDKDEVCRELNIDRDYLRVRVHRALARFRSALAKQPPTARAAKTAGG
ncbi:MAG: sigma-70 family RNA polymerase sigma factor [Bryobacteraceae bacterium]